MTMTAPQPPKQPQPSEQTPAWEILPLAGGGWRVCDGTLSESDASRLVAYVDRHETGTLDVLWLRSPCPTRSRYRNLDELLADLDAAVVLAISSRSTRPTDIPHFPPRG